MTIIARIAVTTALWITFASTAMAQVSLVADLNTGFSIDSSNPREYLSVSPTKAYFQACDQEFGCEIWKTDGTAAGTLRITDICPGACNRTSAPRDLTLIGAKVYLSANDGQRGEEPWVIDIATDTVTILADLLPGSASSSPRQFISTVNVNGDRFVYFSQQSGGNPSRRTRIGRLSSAGAITFTDTAFAWNESVEWVVFNGAIYGVAAPTGTSNFELSRLTLGAVSVSANQVKDIEAGANASSISALKVSFDKILFFASTAVDGRELYASDGTSLGTAIISQINVGPGSSACTDELATVLILNSVVGFFSGAASGQDCELYRTDGTAAGTSLVKDIFPGVRGSSPAQIRSAGAGSVYFVAKESDAIGREFWRSNGTAAGTTLIRDLVPNGGGVMSNVRTDIPALVTSGFFYLLSDSGTLYRTDGNSIGTRAVGSALSPDSQQGSMLAVNGTVLYTATDFVGIGFGREPARTLIASPSVNELLKNIGEDFGDSTPYSFVEFNGRAVFGIAPTSYGAYITQPNAAPLRFSDGVFTESVAVSGSRFYNRWGRELTVSDGTLAGTFNLSPDFNGLGARIMTPFGMYFFAKTRDVNGDGDLDFGDFYDLWRTDGTEAGTVKITSRQTLPDTLFLSDRNDEAILIGNDVFVAGSDSNSSSNNGTEIYRINTTSGTATLLRDIAPGVNSSDPSGFVLAGNTVYFAASDSSNNRELWKTDGTSQGTQQVADTNAIGSSDPRSLVVMGNSLFYTAITSDGSRDVFQTSGSGATLAADFGTVDTVEFSTRLTVSGDRVYFPSINQNGQNENGSRIYFTTGTAASVQQLGGLTSAQPGLAPQEMIAGPSARSIVFSGWDAANGRELWYSDGTHAGTRRVSQIAPDARHSNPEKLARVGSRIYFTADDTATGNEPWVLDVDALDRLFRNGFE